jgi:chromosome partitioning protein
MNVLVFASRKGGSGKSTLTAHLGAHIAKQSRPTLLVDADPQGSIALWHSLRAAEQPALRRATRGLDDVVKAAKRAGFEWLLVDTPPVKSATVADAIRFATFVVIPTRPSMFDLDAVRDTIELCRELRRPYAVVINGAPAKRNDAESAVVSDARRQLAEMNAPVWSGQLTSRADYSLSLASGEGAKEFDRESLATAELAKLWNAVDRSVRAIHAAHHKARTQRVAA